MFASLVTRRTLSLVSSTALAAALAGCTAPADDAVKPRVEVLNQTRSALSAGAITEINGTYGGACDGRAVEGSDSWTFVIGNPGATTLSVRKNDANCVLTVTSLVAGGTFIAAPAIALGASWKLTSSAFAESGEGLAFYGNAMISSTSFSADPTISILVSDAPNVDDAGSKAASYATYSSSVETDTVPASTYTLGFGSFGMQKDVNNVVQSVSGFAQLSEGGVAGDDYAIHHGELTIESTLAEIETAYAGAAKYGTLSSLTDLQLPASDFGLHDPAVDLDDTTKRTVIIRHTDEDVSSYQLLLVTFTP